METEEEDEEESSSKLIEVDDDDFDNGSTNATPSALPPTALATGALASGALSSGAPGVLSAGAQALTMAAARQIMLDNYTPWVMRTYGDSAKTKTITTKKYSRIVNLLKSIENKDNNGQQPQHVGVPEPSGSDLAKFRLWVKSKGFHLGPPAGHDDFGKPEAKEMLYLPTGTDKVSSKCVNKRFVNVLYRTVYLTFHVLLWGRDISYINAYSVLSTYEENVN